jgi:glycerol uptake facilitator-like aquaporin
MITPDASALVDTAQALGLSAAFVLASGSLTGGSMNWARSFGPAVVSGLPLDSQAVY